MRAMNVAFYATFVAKAAEGRKKTPEEIEAVAQGRVWTGARGASRRASSTRSAASTPPSASARERARIPRGRRSSSSCCPERKGFLETLIERQEEDVLARALGPGAASLPALGAAPRRRRADRAAAVRARGPLRPLSCRSAGAGGSPSPR